MFDLPTWSQSASQSIGLLYRELQDIEIYVEDNDSEALYTKILSRTLDERVRIRKVIPLHGRTNVVNKCREYNDDFPAIFIIDGDLDLLLGEREESTLRLYQHRLYCMENYLFCEHASSELLQDASGKLLEHEAYEQLDWHNFSSGILASLLNLFKMYAVSWKLLPEEPTVSRSYHKMCKHFSKNRGPEICHEKVLAVIDEIKTKVLLSFDQATFDEVYNAVSVAVDGLENPLYAISGKDYLLKALRDYLDYKKDATYCLDDGFKFKLARYCNIEPLHELREAILTTVTEGKYLQAP